MANVRFETAIVCDDIRREDNGKEILIGVYSGDITVATFPANLRLFFWISTFVEEGGEQVVNMRVLGPGDVQLIKGEFRIQVSAFPSEGSLPVGPLLLQIQTEGKITLQIKRAGSKWETIKSKNV